MLFLLLRSYSMRAGTYTGIEAVSNGMFILREHTLSDRLVAQDGVVLMGMAAGVILLLTHGSVAYLVVLYSITVFITFVLSQAGMVHHWWMVKDKQKHWKRRMLVSASALGLCVFILITMTILKFDEGGWITRLMLGALITLAIFIRRHDQGVGRILKRMDNLVQAGINA